MHSKYKLDKNTNYVTTATECSLLDLESREANYGFIMVYNQIYTALADVCFSEPMITLSAY